MDNKMILENIKDILKLSIIIKFYENGEKIKMFSMKKS